MTAPAPAHDTLCVGSGQIPTRLPEAFGPRCSECGVQATLDRVDNVVAHLSGYPAHIRTGAGVAEYTIGRGDRSQRDTVISTIVRVTKTQVRVTRGHPGDETSYRRRELTGGRIEITRQVGGAWGDSWSLRPTDDPDVLAAIEGARMRRAARQIESLARKWHEGDLSAAVAIADILGEAGVVTDWTILPPYSTQPLARP